MAARLNKGTELLSLSDPVRILIAAGPGQRVLVVVEVVVPVAGPPSLSSPPAATARAAPAIASAPIPAGTAMLPNAELIALLEPAGCPVPVEPVPVVDPLSPAGVSVPGAGVFWENAAAGVSARAADRAKTAERTMKLPSVLVSGPSCRARQ
ncbi:hypothetical protein [Indioceanicola profundi]|uniref:hypothetical protein n=1 Tax=Indioceanicola profundi TaxID=2220096 RepID=UPI001968D7D6|nr:hypothetical protein [Indioceanicola profundi]